MTIDDIKVDPCVIDFLKTRSVRQSTANEYIKRLTIYCDFIDKKPTQLIEEAENEEEANIRMKRRKIKRYLTDFLIHLRKNNKYTTIYKW